MHRDGISLSPLPRLLVTDRSMTMILMLLLYLLLKAKLACHPARCLLPVESIKRCRLDTGQATVELLPYLLPY